MRPTNTGLFAIIWLSATVIAGAITATIWFWPT
jgi:hypothetical protein